MKKLVYLLLFITIGSLSAKDIEKVHHLSGKIIDEGGIPIENVGVYNKTNGGYSYTDSSGGFKLQDISVNDIINFHIIGFETKEITVTENELDKNVSITLKEAAVSLDQVVLVSKVNALSKIVDVDIKTTPIKSAQEILRKVPGLIIGQHGGGGKAEQIFLRGFDIDHGTDVSISVDGLPVNLVSHAHGQGYADLHFVIPETIDNLDFGKGPYNAGKGNFTTAGYIDLNLKKRIENNLLSVEVGQFNTLRAVGLLEIFDKGNSSAYVASEALFTDGVFDAPQNFNRFNILGRYNYRGEGEEVTLTLSHFQSKWDQSGQIPLRSVDQIGRFGAIDPTEGGNTSRSNFLINHSKQLGENSLIKTNAFLSRYDFELFSNFTFFLNDPVNGDQIRQFEERTIIGAETVFSSTPDFLNLNNHDNVSFNYKAGFGFRYDDVNDIELSRTVQRRPLSIATLGNVDETNVYAFADATLKVDRFTFVPGVRIDYFKFDFENLLSETFDSRSEDEVFVSPKLNVLYDVNENLQLFTKLGVGFHSNDSRVVTNPQGLGVPNDDNQDLDVLPGAFGVDLGAIIKPIDKFVINAALWGLFLQQEFVYVGDEAVVEPSGRSRRLGIDLGLRYQVTDWLYVNTDINYAFARSVDEPDGQDFIPLAPDFTSVGGISVKNLGKLSGGINYRFIDDRPANEDNTIVADGYFVTDFNLNYNFVKNWNLGLIIENLFDTEWNETQFATETRLFNEAESVEEITFTPGTPFQARFKLSVNF